MTKHNDITNRLLEEYVDLIRDLPFDIRTEVFAAQLIEKYGLGIEQIVVRPKGLENRKGEKEVSDIDTGWDDFEKKDIYYLDVNREGLFDTLPIMFFLPAKPTVPKNDNSKAVQDASKIAIYLEKQMQLARRFFLPFDQAFYHARIKIERWEKEFSSLLSGSKEKTLQKFWQVKDFTDCLDEKQCTILLYLLPIAQSIVGNWELTKYCFEAILQKKVEITIRKKISEENKTYLLHPIPSENVLGLGEGSLGKDFLLGDTFFDGIPVVSIKILDVEANQLDDYIQENGRYKKLIDELLCMYFLPLEAHCVVEVKAMQSDEDFTFYVEEKDTKHKKDDNSIPYYNILGYNTIL